LELSGVDAATFNPEALAAVLAAALFSEPGGGALMGTIHVSVDHVSGLAFALALQGARSLTAAGLGAARGALALALGVAEERVGLQASLLRRRRSVLATSSSSNNNNNSNSNSSSSMTLRVVVSGLQASVQAATGMAAAAGSAATAAALAASLASEGVTAVALAAPPTLALVLAVSSPGVAAALLAAQLNASTGEMDAALHAAGLLAVIGVAPLLPQPPPPSPAGALLSPPPPAAFSPLPPGAAAAVRAPSQKVLVAVVVCSVIAVVAGCVAGGAYLRRRAKVAAKEARKCMTMPLEWHDDEEYDGTQKASKSSASSNVASMEAGHTRSSGPLFAVAEGKGAARDVGRTHTLLLRATSRMVARDASEEQQEHQRTTSPPSRATSPLAVTCNV
jgi:hypothetical protein